jgi:hypothetical protein
MCSTAGAGVAGRRPDVQLEHGDHLVHTEQTELSRLELKKKLVYEAARLSCRASFSILTHALAHQTHLTALNSSPAISACRQTSSKLAKSPSLNTNSADPALLLLGPISAHYCIRYNIPSIRHRATLDLDRAKAGGQELPGSDRSSVTRSGSRGSKGEDFCLRTDQPIQSYIAGSGG